MKEKKIISTALNEAPQNPERRSFLKGATVGSAVIAGSLPFGGLLKASEASAETRPRGGPALTPTDRDILIAAEIAEALAVTTYTNIINTAPFFANLASDDQGYLNAARHEEM